MSRALKASVSGYYAWYLNKACKAASADSAATGCTVARTVRHAMGSSIHIGISGTRLTCASRRAQRAAAPLARSITSWTRTARPAQGCQE